MTDDPILESLQRKLQQKAITLPALQEGIQQCFILTNRDFLRRRLGEDYPTEKMDAITRDLVNQIFTENGISPSYAPLSALRKACETLEAQLGFEANPEKLTAHQKIIARLFDLLPGQD